jgi:uncharacterized protein (DUF1778 family)
MGIRKPKKQDKRVQVNLMDTELALVRRAAKTHGETVPAFIRRVLLKTLESETEQSFVEPLLRIEHSADLILARLSKLERVQRYVMMNTAIARGHATGTLDASDPAASEKIRHRIVEARDHQRAIFFDLYPEQKE